MKKEDEIRIQQAINKLKKQKPEFSLLDKIETEINEQRSKFGHQKYIRTY
jgi:hypothetical protein